MTGDPWAQLSRGPLPPAVPEDDIAIIPGAIYSSIPGFRPLELDLYVPLASSASGLPAIVWIHGGAFALGSRKLPPDFLVEADLFRRLARAGFVVAAIDYRLSGEARWPSQLVDVRAAIRWLRGRADEIGVDPESIAVWGESAGGHLAAMAGILGTRSRPEEPDGLDLPRVAAVVDWYGPTRFRAMDEQAPPGGMVHDDADSPESRLLGGPIQELEAIADDADPTAHVSGDEPPFLIRHGRRDRLVPFGQSVLLAERLRESGADVTFHVVQDADHVFEGYATPLEFVDEAIEFLRRTLPAARRTAGTDTKDTL